eukprot:m.101480 g.101480  ORF g.101480 m.101480 type:complete len:1224 (-) comp15660_c3_seq5:415-4086(-)
MASPPTSTQPPPTPTSTSTQAQPQPPPSPSTSTFTSTTFAARFSSVGAIVNTIADIGEAAFAWIVEWPARLLLHELLQRTRHLHEACSIVFTYMLSKVFALSAVFFLVLTAHLTLRFVDLSVRQIQLGKAGLVDELSTMLVVLGAFVASTSMVLYVWDFSRDSLRGFPALRREMLLANRNWVLLCMFLPLVLPAALIFLDPLLCDCHTDASSSAERCVPRYDPELFSAAATATPNEHNNNNGSGSGSSRQESLEAPTGDSSAAGPSSRGETSVPQVARPDSVEGLADDTAAAVETCDTFHSSGCEVTLPPGSDRLDLPCDPSKSYSRDELIGLVRAYATSKRFTIIKHNDQTDRQRIRLVCSRSGTTCSRKPNNHSSSPKTKRRRMRKSKKCGCQWQVVAYQDETCGDLQTFHVRRMNLVHTGGCLPSEEQLRRFAPPDTVLLSNALLKQLIQLVGINISTSSLRLFLEQEFPTRQFSPLQIANLRARVLKAKASATDGQHKDLDELLQERGLDADFPAFVQLLREDKTGLTIQQLVTLLKERIDGLETALACDGNNTVTGVFLMTKRQRARAERYAQWVTIDGTFGSNSEGFVLCLPCVMNEHGEVYPIAFVIMFSEHSNTAYQWMLQKLAQYCPAFLIECRAILTDGGFSEAVTHAVLGPHVAHLRCSFHLLTLNLDRQLHGNPDRDAIRHFIKEFLQEAPSEQAFMTAWAQFQAKYARYDKLIAYLNAHVISIRHAWSRPWRDRTMHGRWTASQGAESLNAAFKRQFMEQADRFMNIQRLILSLIVFERRNENREYVTHRDHVLKRVPTNPAYVENTAFRCGKEARDHLRAELRAAMLYSARHLPDHAMPHLPHQAMVQASTPSNFEVHMSASSARPDGPQEAGPVRVRALLVNGYVGCLCECLQDVRHGIPCRHILATLKFLLDHGQVDETVLTHSVNAMVHPRWFPAANNLCGMAAQSLALVVACVGETCGTFSLADCVGDDLDRALASASPAGAPALRDMPEQDEDITREGATKEQRLQYVLQMTKRITQAAVDNVDVFTVAARHLRDIVAHIERVTPPEVGKEMNEVGDASVVNDPHRLASNSNGRSARQRVFGQGRRGKSLTTCGWCKTLGHTAAVCSIKAQMGHQVTCTSLASLQAANIPVAVLNQPTMRNIPADIRAVRINRYSPTTTLVELSFFKILFATPGQEVRPDYFGVVHVNDLFAFAKKIRQSVFVL